MVTFYIQPDGPRPDFRLVITFLWDDFHNVDTEGDSYNPASRTWTELYCQNRENKDEVFDVSPEKGDPLILAISAERGYLAARVAYFLATETRSGVASRADGPYENPDHLKEVIGTDFDLDAARGRANASCWRRSSVERPYPNLG